MIQPIQRNPMPPSLGGPTTDDAATAMFRATGTGPAQRVPPIGSMPVPTPPAAPPPQRPKYHSGDYDPVEAQRERNRQIRLAREGAQKKVTPQIRPAPPQVQTGTATPPVAQPPMVGQGSWSY